MKLPRLTMLALCLLSVFALTATAQTTLEAVKARGKLVCGVNTGLTGFCYYRPRWEMAGF